MLLSVEKRFLFVANTKTASTSIEVALHPYAEILRTGTPERKHTPLHRIFEAYGFMFDLPEHDPDSYFKFGVMRDPIDWINSWYRYRRGNQVEAPLPQEMSFAEFWEQKDWNIRRWDGSANLQRDMFCAPDGTVLADVIIPYPRLAEMFAEICDALGIDRPLERQNVSNLQPNGDLPDALRREMRDYYAADYTLLDQLQDLNEHGMARLRARRDADARVPDSRPAAQTTRI